MNTTESLLTRIAEACETKAGITPNESQHPYSIEDSLLERIAEACEAKAEYTPTTFEHPYSTKETMLERIAKAIENDSSDGSGGGSGKTLVGRYAFFKDPNLSGTVSGSGNSLRAVSVAPVDDNGNVGELTDIDETGFGFTPPYWTEFKIVSIDVDTLQNITDINHFEYRLLITTPFFIDLQTIKVGDEDVYATIRPGQDSETVITITKDKPEIPPEMVIPMRAIDVVVNVSVKIASYNHPVNDRLVTIEFYK